MSGLNYDFIIVGGGSAGSVLANRLSADPANRVLVLEAGRRDYRWDIAIQMPAAMFIPIGNRFYDWQYETEPEPDMGGRRIRHARGRVLGGSSSINGMVWQRGNPMDYERWAREPGMETWDYAHCLPYFKRMESSPDGPSEFRGHAGPLILERAPLGNPIARAFIQAAVEAGYVASDDLNGYRQEGFAAMDRNIHRGRRLSASHAYLRPAKARPNLDIQSRCLVHRVLFKGKRAVGVEYSRGRGRTRQVHAGQVILCGGAFNTPQMLQLSGVGNADELRRLGIEVVQDLPGVGENLQDHLEVYIQHASKRPASIAPAMKWRNRPRIGFEWLFQRKGLGATNHLEAGGFVRTHQDAPYPNLLFHFLPIAIRVDGRMPTKGHSYQAHITPVLSDTRGSVKIKSTDPRAHPAILFNYLATEQDRREWIESVRITREILSQPALEPFDAGELSPGPAVRTGGQILDWVAANGETSLHPSCTCKMGFDDMAVVDPKTMAVHGVEGLLVSDASAMPHITNGNTYAPTMMLAEKAADLIAGATPLPVAKVEFYRNEKQPT